MYEPKFLTPLHPKRPASGNPACILSFCKKKTFLVSIYSETAVPTKFGEKMLSLSLFKCNAWDDFILSLKEGDKHTSKRRVYFLFPPNIGVCDIKR